MFGTPLARRQDHSRVRLLLPSTIARKYVITPSAAGWVIADVLKGRRINGGRERRDEKVPEEIAGFPIHLTRRRKGNRNSGSQIDEGWRSERTGRKITPVNLSLMSKPSKKTVSHTSSGLLLKSSEYECIEGSRFFVKKRVTWIYEPS